jgi:hypothetical protein
LVAWVLFAYYWWLVSRRRLNPATLSALTILFASVGFVCLLTLIWIRHNLQVAQRAKGRRKNRRDTPTDSASDVLGRTIEETGSKPLSSAHYVELEVLQNERVKRYRAMAPPDEEVRP